MQRRGVYVWKVGGGMCKMDVTIHQGAMKATLDLRQGSQAHQTPPIKCKGCVGLASSEPPLIPPARCVYPLSTNTLYWNSWQV